MNKISSLDNISRLFSLQASSKESVVSEEKLSNLQNKLYIESKLDKFLKEYCIKGLKSNKTKLIILSGNAGDGKSMTLRKLRDNLEQEGVSKNKIHANADATQTDSRNENLNYKLINFFSDFFKDHKSNNKKVYIIAMNVGIAIKFFNSKEFINECQDNKNLELIKEIIFNELNITRIDSSLKKQYKKLNNNILVANFDLRCIVKPNIEGIEINDKSFFKKIIDKVYDLLDMKKCDNCKKNQRCPIYFNLKMFQYSEVIDRVENLLFKVFLYNKVHLTPRNVWDFIYFILTGGETKYIDIITKNNYKNPCDYFKKSDQINYSKFLFYNNLFDNDSENAILEFIRESIDNFDAIYIGNKELELLKILANANPKHFLKTLKEKSNKFITEELDKEKIIELIFNPILKNEENTKSELMKNICRYLYFFKGDNENKIPDVLVTDFSQILNSEYFKSFYHCLKAEKTKMLNQNQIYLDKDLLKMIRKVLVNTFGNKLSDKRIIQLETMTTRSKGRLLGEVEVNMDKTPYVQSYWQNVEAVKALDFFPNYFTVRINDDYHLKVTLDLFELIVLAHNGYNISSVDLERFNQLKVLSKKIMPKEVYNNKSIFYEVNNDYFKLIKDIDVEFKKIN
ncbi:MAG: hypothetical protein ACQEQF_06695 [Bacillota bacterium]